jgi:hypothetical protein
MVADNYDVRSWRKNGQHLLTVSLSDSDLNRKWGALFDHFVGERKQRRRDFKVETNCR